MAYGESNGQVTDDVMCPWKVNVVTPIRLGLHIWGRQTNIKNPSISAGEMHSTMCVDC